LSSANYKNPAIKRVMISIIVLVITLVIIIAITLINKPKPPIYIGFTGGLTGSLSSLGVEARNAFELRIAEVNAAGGINGRLIETVILNDENNPDTFRQNMANFRENNINIIIGPIISSLAVAAHEEAYNLILLSGSIASDTIVNMDDYFFRTVASTQEQSKALINYLETGNDYKDLPSVSIIYDSRNSAFVNEWRDYFSENYSGNVTAQYEIGLSDSITDAAIIAKISKNPSDVLLLLTPSLETATFAQLIKINDLPIEPIAISWAMTNDLITNGGTAVEDLKFVYVNYPNGLPHENPQFFSDYMDAYSEAPSFISGFYYECTSFLLEAIRVSPSLDIEDIKATLLNLEYTVLNDTIDLNEYGDRKQEFTMFILRDGKYELIVEE